MACTHPTGDHVLHYWLCAHCYKKLDKQPGVYRVQPVPASGAEWNRDRPRWRQVFVGAPVAVCDGVKLSEFIAAMAQRIVARTKGGMKITEATSYASDLLRDIGEPFGNDAFQWDTEGAWDIVDEDMTYWDADESASN